MAGGAKSTQVGELASDATQRDELVLPRIEPTIQEGGYLIPRCYAGLEARDLIVVCAGPSTGKTHLAMVMQQACAEAGKQVLRCAFTEADPHVASDHLSRFARNIENRTQGEDIDLVVIDGVTPGDEADTARSVRAIQHMRSLGCRVIVCLCPENEQLAEALDDALRLSVDDLVFRHHDDELCCDWELTAGMPPLVAALREDVRAGVEEGEAGPRYVAALQDVVAKAVRPWMPEEECRLRLAMLLLGQGTEGDLALLAGRCDAEMLALLQRATPLFGIDARERRFCCVGVCHDEVFASCFAALQPHVAQRASIVVRACGLLAARGDTRRSAIACRLAASERDYVRIATTWGVAYAAVGQVKLVEEALRIVNMLGAPKDNMTLLSEAAVASLTKPVQKMDEALERVTTLQLATTTEAHLLYHTRLLGACRDALRNPSQTSRLFTVESADALGLACLDHLNAVRLMASGHAQEAYTMLTQGMRPGGPQSIPQAYLCDDLYLALVLSGGMPDKQECHLFGSALRMYDKARMGKAVLYHHAIAAMPGILMGEQTEAQAIDDAVMSAERAGDTLCQVVFTLVSAVGDLRAGALSRAHVRASHAAALARTIGERFLASSAELLDALTQALLGEHGVLATYCERHDRPHDLVVMGMMAARAAGELSLSASDIVPLGTPCPQDALWLFNVLATDCRGISQGVAKTAPAAWLGTLRGTKERQATVLGLRQRPVRRPTRRRGKRRRNEALRQGEQRELLPISKAGCRVRVSVMGGIALEVDGQSVFENCYDRRRARDLIALLAIVPSHRIRRFQAIEILWPDTDYYRGLRKLYEATGEARKLLGGRDGGIDPLVSDRAQGTIGFDPAVVSCDVDDFEREARLALAEDGDDFWVLDHAQQMERLYAGGPDQHLAGFGQQVINRLEELIAQYVDAAVAAGEAALRLGRNKQAIRYALDAHRTRFLREDAMILLVQALRAAGRGFEVATYYRSYSQRLIEEQGRPPSQALRRLVELAGGTGGDTSVP